MANEIKISRTKSAGNNVEVTVDIFKDGQQVARKSYLVKPGPKVDVKAVAIQMAEKELEAGGSAHELKQRAKKIKEDEALLEKLLREKKARDKDTPGALDKFLSLFK